MALSEGAAAAIIAGASALGSVGSAGISSARNMRIARYSADFQREQIREQNKYNSPLEQMRRYQEAGLNPNLIYGEGSVSSGNQSGIAKYDTPDLPTPDLGPILGNILENVLRIKQLNADLALKEQELENKKEEQFNLRSTRLGVDIDNAFKSVVTGFNPGLVLSTGDRESILQGMQFKKYSNELQGIEQMNALHKAQTDLAKFSAEHQREIINKLIPAQVRLMDAQADGKDVETELNKIELGLQHNLEAIGGKTALKLIMDFLRIIVKK